MDVRSVAGVPELQAETLGDRRVCAAILDGPVDLSHPCFAGADLTTLDTLVPNTPSTDLMSMHGTHVASVVFGQPPSPVFGLAPRCRGLIAPVFRDGKRLSQLDLSRAIEQAVEAGASIINISGGERAPTGEPEGILAHALQLCADNGVLVVAAVGNDGCDCKVPAAVASTLAVGAAGPDGRPLESSNWGQAYLANGILAPGKEIRGASPGGGTVLLTGSSFATPVVTGIAALLVSPTAQRRDRRSTGPPRGNPRYSDSVSRRLQWLVPPLPRGTTQRHASSRLRYRRDDGCGQFRSRLHPV